MLSSLVHPAGSGARRSWLALVTLPAPLALFLTSLVLVGTGSGSGAAAADPPGSLTSSGSLDPARSLTSTGSLVAAGPARWTPPADTVVAVHGSALDGFTLSRYDGSKLFPPTGSEARAECGEYDRRIDRVRCRVEVATWYRDLEDLKLSLRWARQQ